MRHRGLIAVVMGAALALVAPTAAGADSSLPGTVQEDVKVLPLRCLRAPDGPGPLCGGDGGGCWVVEPTRSESHWYGSWNHVFRVMWCGNYWAITYARVVYHTQSANGAYGPNGLPSPYVSSGCVGCGHIRWNAQARFTFTAPWPPFYTSHFDSWHRLTLYPWGAFS